MNTQFCSCFIQVLVAEWTQVCFALDAPHEILAWCQIGNTVPFHLSRYGDSHYKDKTVVRPSCLIHPGVLDKPWLSEIITLVRHKKARFDSKMHGSTQKSPVRHKNARFDTKMPSPACTSWHCHYQTSPRPSCEKYFFLILFQDFVFKNQ